VLNSSYRSRLNNLIDRFGEVEDLGQCFRDAARPTSANVSLITLQVKPDNLKHKPKFRLKFDPDLNTQHLGKITEYEDLSLVESDVFEAMESRYNAAIMAWGKMLEAMRELDFYAGPLLSPNKSPSDLIGKVLGRYGDNYDQHFNMFIDALGEQAWHTAFSKTKMVNVATEDVQKQLYKLQEHQEGMPFTAANLTALFQMLAANMEHIMIDCVCSVFDWATKYAHKNRENRPGYKTNSDYDVRMKFIIPNMKSSSWATISSEGERSTEDLEKAMCFLTGKKFEQIKHISAQHKRGLDCGEWQPSEFFDTKLFAGAGTMHFRFREESLCDDFNRLVSIHRPGWLAAKNKSGVYR